MEKLKGLLGSLKLFVRRMIAFVGRYRRRILIILAVIIGAQLLYPSALSKPLVFSSGRYLGFRSSSSLSRYYENQTNAKLTLHIGNEERDIKLADAGIRFDMSKTKVKTNTDPLWQRLIPLSILWPVAVGPQDWQSIDDQKNKDFSAAISSEYYRPPKNAAAARNESAEFILNPSEKGRELPKENLRLALRSNHIEQSADLNFQFIIIEPIITDAMVQSVIEKTKPANIQPLAFNVAGKTYPIAPQTIQPWLTIEVDEIKKEVLRGFDDTLVEAWVVQNVTAVNSGRPTVITLSDGVEVSRAEGVAGKSIDKKKAGQSIKAAVLSKQAEAKGEIIDAPIKIETVRTYSATTAGLQLLISEWSKEYPGMESGVYLHELSGRGLAAEKNSSAPTFAASLYKLFIALFINETIADQNQTVYENKTYAQCLEVMIRVSDNNCPEKIIEKHTTNTINAFVAGKGFGATNIAKTSTSPRDAGLFLERLYAGSLMDQAKTTQLLGLMRAQIYRSGIPAGSAGARVADKPGFYGASWHDAAIVEGPRSTYVLVVMTKGPGSVAVKTLAQRVYQTLN